MSIQHMWGVECRKCGARSLMRGGPRGHSALSGHCNEEKDMHSEKAIFGPDIARDLKRNLGSYSEVAQKFEKEQLTKDELLELID